MYRINSPILGGAHEKWKLYREVLQCYLYYFRLKEREKRLRHRRHSCDDGSENNEVDNVADDNDNDDDGDKTLDRSARW